MNQYKELKEKLNKASYVSPFTSLGIQDSAEIALTVWQPHALRVSIQVENNEYELFQLVDGLFGLPREVFNLTHQCYRVHTTYKDSTHSYVDPYQFTELNLDYGRIHDPAVSYKEMGAQLCSMMRDGVEVQGTRFVVYAPNASAASVIGDFNHWDGRRHPMQKMAEGFWALFVPGIEAQMSYKYELKDGLGNGLPHKADPWGFHSDQYPSLASRVYDHNSYQWQDSGWQNREFIPQHKAPLSFYELHAGSWKRNAQGEFLTYRELASELIPYLVEMGYTHLELMPVSEYPYYGSWGYQPIGLFAPTSRFGSPDDFKFFVDSCHQAGIAVVLDWVPAHFPADGHGLANFDGSALFNDPDPRRGWHPDWNSYIYDYSRPHVREFLIANALYWLDLFHIDGLRVDAVASMLYLDYSRKDGEWVPNWEGGNHNNDAISLLRWMNQAVYHHHPKAITIAEESTAFDGVTRPTNLNGLGFGFKWNMGWMHDSLGYMQENPIHRKYHHHELTFPLVYAFSENYVLSLSHDEVVYGKKSIHDKMPGDEWQKAANLRAYLGYMYGQPGKKLNFMGTELGQTAEWDLESQLQWHWMEYDKHRGIQKLVKDLNHLYKTHPALYQRDNDPTAFKWCVMDDSENSVIAHERLDDDNNRIMVVSNFTPVPRNKYFIPTEMLGKYTLLLNTDANQYWGSGREINSEFEIKQGGIEIDLPPLSTLFLAWNK